MKYFPTTKGFGLGVLSILLLTFAGCGKLKDTLNASLITPGVTNSGSGVIQGKLVTPENMGVGNQQVVLYSATSVSVASFSTLIRAQQSSASSEIVAIATTDTAGNFKFSNINFGKYTIVTQASDNNAAYFGAVTLSTVEPILQLGEIALILKGTLRGKVDLDGGASPLGVDIFIPGTNLIAKTDEVGEFKLDVPEGNYSIILAKYGYTLQKKSNVAVAKKSNTDLGRITLSKDKNISSSEWHLGSGTPSTSMGNDGDVYLDSSSADFYTKSNGVWTNQGGLKTVVEGTNTGSGGQWLVDSGLPSAEVGLAGDLYLNQSNNDYYFRSKTGWEKKGSLKGSVGNAGTNGSNGAAGTQWITGSGNPETSVGISNDLYLNTTTGAFFKKSNNAWVSIWAHLKGHRVKTSPYKYQPWRYQRL